MKRTIITVFALGMATAGLAQDSQKMLSAGEHFALRSLDNIPEKGVTGTFAYRGQNGQWENTLTMSCDAIRNRTAFLSAMDARLDAKLKDLPSQTGADWSKLEDDILSAMNKLHDLCNLNSKATPPTLKTGLVEP